MVHTFSLIAFYAAFILTFIALIMLINLVIQDEKRRKCMSHHPAGTRRMTEQSPTGQMKTISQLAEQMQFKQGELGENWKESDRTPHS